MKTFRNDVKIIGIDHGYGNIKTENSCFPAGVTVSDVEPTFKENLLVWNGKYYIIGAEHKEFIAEKMHDDDYYVMTLAAIAEELKTYGLKDARVYLAAGLPLTWVSFQREMFLSYLLRESEVEFNYKGTDYHVEILGAMVYPQGFAAVIDEIDKFENLNMLCDIGNGTMNIMFINDKKVDVTKCYTEKFGTQQCMIEIRENLMKLHHAALPEETIIKIINKQKVNIDEEYLKTVEDTVKEYVKKIFVKLGEHGYDPKIMDLHVVGGGGCLIKNFAEPNERIKINDDICATAKGYERMLQMMLNSSR